MRLLAILEGANHRTISTLTRLACGQDETERQTEPERFALCVPMDECFFVKGILSSTFSNSRMRLCKLGQ